MRDKLLHPGTILGTVALMVALGCTSYAITAVPRNSVGTKQLRANSVTSAKVRNGTLRARDFRAGELPTSPAGPQGQAGPPGISGWQIVRLEDQPTNDWAELDVKCPAGKKALGGGVAAKGGTTWPIIRRDAPDATGTGWIGVKSGSTGPSSLSVYAVCAYVS